MVNELNIKFDGNSKEIFYPKQTIAILVELKLDKLIKKVKGLRMIVSGAAIAKWTEGGGRNSVTYQGEQVFFKSVNYFFGKEGGEPIEVSSGVHLYKFSCRIPRNAPGSVEGKFGYIRYKVEVNLDIPFSTDMNTKQPFVVFRHEDLNQYPELKLPSEGEEVKTFCCFLCESDPLMIKISTSQSGYSLGEKITVKVDIYNRSNVTFSKSLISLNRVETFKSYSPVQKSKKNITSIVEKISKGARAHKNSSFEEVLQVPQKASLTNDRICDVFQISYEIQVILKAAKKSSGIRASLPIFIGDVEFRLNSNVSIDSDFLPMEDLPPFCKAVGNSKNVLPAYVPHRFDFVL